jgi:hypothetical protein
MQYDGITFSRVTQRTDKTKTAAVSKQLISEKKPLAAALGIQLQL